MNRVLRNPYEVLGVSAGASDDAVKAAYRKLALQYHPDRNPGDRAAEERFKELSEAYATLRDPASRERFDRYGAERPEVARPDFSTVDWQTVFQEADLHIDWDVRGGGTMPRTGNAVFDLLFGYLAGVMRNSGLLPGEDRLLELELGLSEARRGGERRLYVPGPSVCPVCRGEGQLQGGLCPRCNGRGVLRGGSSLDVTVPPGVRDGVKLRLKGLGGPGQPPGDVLVTVRLRLPPEVELAGNDLYLEVSVTPLEAAQGARLTVLGVGVEVPPGSREGAELRAPGGGLAGGDLVVTLRRQLWPGLWRGLRDGLRSLVKGVS